MHTPHQKFRISQHVAEIFKQFQFSAQTAKLLFTLIFLQDQTDEGWPTILYENQVSEEHFVFVNLLRDISFPAKTGSSRFLRNPVAELTSPSGVFDRLEISKNGRFLTWKFSEGFFDLMAEMDVYALIDAREIGFCQRKYDGALMAQIALHRKKRVPEFRLFGVGEGYESNITKTDVPIVPSQIARQLRPALQNMANAMHISFAIIFVQEGASPGYTDILIRMRHQNTKWPEGRFLKRPPSSLFWMVEPEASEMSAQQPLWLT